MSKYSDRSIVLPIPPKINKAIVDVREDDARNKREFVGKPANVVEEPDESDEEFVFADKPIISFTQEDLNQLSPYLGRNLTSKEEMMIAISNMSTVNCAGVEIPLEPGLLTRVKSRAIRRDFPEFLRETVIAQLHSFVGW